MNEPAHAVLVAKLEFDRDLEQLVPTRAGSEGLTDWRMQRGGRWSGTAQSLAAGLVIGRSPRPATLIPPDRERKSEADDPGCPRSGSDAPPATALLVSSRDLEPG